MKKDCDELYISYLFPPSNQASGITVFKRIVEENSTVDVLQSNFHSDNSSFNDYVEKHINNRFHVEIDEKLDWAVFIYDFIKKGLDIIENRDYKKIYSRSWLMANHFLACEYKFKNPETFWRAEFSDPLIYDLNNNPKDYDEMIIDDKNYISDINNQIKLLNRKNDSDYPLVENGTSAYFIAEYLVYLFADRIIFTNENQMKIMLDEFPVDVKEHVSGKCEIKRHPTLNEEFYHINEVDLNLNDEYINVAYFGNDYYSKRHFEALFYAVEALNHKYKDKVRVYLYVSNRNMVKKLLPSERFIIKKPLEYPDFLNATTKFDVLLVNDVTTNGVFEANPYLPSKLSDYMGAKTDVWALYEPGSALSKTDVKYKSDMYDYDACLKELVRILGDCGFKDEDFSVNQKYLNDRFTYLNELYEKEYRQKNNYKRKCKKLKNEKNSERGWNISKSLRRLKG